MAQSDAFTAIEHKRWQGWTEGKDHGLSDEQIAQRLHVSRSTITRLKRKARQNGAYQDWANTTLDWSREELRELHQQIKQSNPVKAYQQMGRLIERSLTQRIEQTTDMTIDANVQNSVTLDLSVLNENEHHVFTNLITKLFEGSVGTERP